MRVAKIFSPSLDWLLVGVPAAFLLRYVPGWRNETALFIVSAAAIVPLAGRMGTATDEIAGKVGAGLGGLINASFGNAAELIIALVALKAGLIGVVKASITGSIIGNLVLVLGTALVAGGVRHRRQCFDGTAARAACTALCFAAFALIVPGVFHRTAATRQEGWTPALEQRLSLAIATVLITSYAAVLWFTLGTHRHLATARPPDSAATVADPPARRRTLAGAVLMLLLATGCVAWLSEFLVGSIEHARASLGLTETFVGVIVVAMVGNAAEHSTAIGAAWRNKLDLTLAITTGSSLQIALFVAPVLVFASYAFGRQLTLEFTLPEISAVFAAVFLTAQISGDGESNWLEGAQLIALYAIFALLFYFLPG